MRTLRLLLLGILAALPSIALANTNEGISTSSASNSAATSACNGETGSRPYHRPGSYAVTFGCGGLGFLTPKSTGSSYRMIVMAALLLIGAFRRRASKRHGSALADRP